MGLPERVAVQRRLVERGSGVDERVIAAVLREVPAYSTISPAQLAETRAIAAWAIRRLIEMWIDDSTLTAADLQRFRGIGAARATDGRPLFAVLRAYRVAAVEISDLVIDLASDGLALSDVVALNRTLLTGVDQLSESLFAGYNSAVEQLNSNRTQMLAGLTHDLLTGRQTSAAVLADRAAQLGVAIPAALALVVVAPDSTGTVLSEGDVADLASSISSAGGGQPLDVLHALRRHQGVLLAATIPDLTGELKFRKWRACVIRKVTPAALPAEFRLASAALDHATDEAYANSPILDRGDAMLVALLRGQPSVDPAELAAEALGPVAEARNAHLREGLSGYLRWGSSTEAAERLGLHPQTMRHRLRRVTELSGRDIRLSWDRLMLDIARSVGEVADRDRTPTGRPPVRR
ncbi:helix-turn-helix domain-containing protein [Micromonospora peucetia]|uniref:PucR family transcriptional regulator n=1 Tax=Micromonospora peucetia TaxID=47871 RepID=UPI0022568317|nr:helix-turn-helix domain-containing protein [Micromonospora peucetia]MCX4389576.1 helix-turn-helix domain-containing protein [Micromonospora peucetia]